MYRALFRKAWTLQLRQRGANLCQVLTPMCVLGLLLLLQLIIRSEFGASETVLVPALPVPLNFNLFSSEPDPNGNCAEFFWVRPRLATPAPPYASHPHVHPHPSSRRRPAWTPDL